MSLATFDTLLGGRKIIAVLRGRDSSQYEGVIETLIDSGVNGIELTMTTPGTLDALPALQKRFADDACIGVGTVVKEEAARKAIDMGAEYLVAPNLKSDVVSVAVDAAVPMLPGVLTPSEVQQALDLGVQTVKIFPAQTVGAGYLKHLRGPFPELQAIPSGGVDLDTARAWLSAGAPAVSVGGPLLGDVFSTGDLAGLGRTASAFVRKLETDS
ncbi:bifunctional 4-hydroxy-2-oxoglutarate aldolase/2-dehydro-3-deoxy-phosphogluconate aldolase [Brevibacterium sp. UCMA 11752]|uniref:bifunctional 4-hydroxy-2-oxoglutarate aldolase/2-dehydro-3-deoxy-phosphogluconate aldolase n=1 Tax=Brevibacterium sp. UCMA 11752 TaxID=2745946 RepID=UPI001F418A88|nr:bifunctional 4-hydroxy-2-oxoglutarate aldolase/2-dehydro-3-deoxy-phosphogluconate aldolase [Brevibacterium sp. UCMA 11752]MCF2587057.1 bifunctional 4-hydroxy-2-oxoglutarate aldolase/2-dehydro-3-deoxy-phosphogluconate aldolase [Brevibacterium sp. UCMA 11752]